MPEPPTIHVVRASYAHHTRTYGAFHDPDLAEEAREDVEATLLYGEVHVEEVRLYPSLACWREKEYPQEAAEEGALE